MQNDDQLYVKFKKYNFKKCNFKEYNINFYLPYLNLFKNNFNFS